MDDTEEADSLVRAVAAAPPRSPRSPSIPMPSRIGRFVIHKQIGAGGMGVVYRATDPDLVRTVAVKLIHPREDAALRASASARLLREAQAMAQLSHPNVVPIFEIGDHDGSVYLAMEYIDGETLTQWMRAPRTWQETLDCFLQAAAGLAAAHAAGLIHRDFKPDNALRGHDGRVRVLDFGLARLFSTDQEGPGSLAADLTQMGAVVGTPLFMAPEQHDGEAATARSDQFSFCVSLWQALYGSHPFAGETREELARSIRAGITEPVAREVAPEAMLIALKRGLAAAPADRFPSMGALIASLEQAHEAGSPTRPPLMRRSETDFRVGYATERKRLAELLADVDAGEARTVVVTGDAGIGKSSMLGDFIAHARKSETVLVATGTCDGQHGSSEAYLPFLEATSRLTKATARIDVRGLLQCHAPMWSLRIPSLQLSQDERARLLADTEGGTPARMRREFCDFARALSRLTTVVLALEDFHWADPSSLALLQELVACTDGARVMIVVTTRSALSIDATPYLTRMELGGLTASDVETYLDQRFAPNRFTHRFRGELYGRCRGNPLILGSLLELATRRGVIKREGIEWTDASDFDLENDTPEVLHAVVDARLRAVPRDVRAMLEYASVAGDRFSPLLVAHVTGTPVAEVLSKLAPVERSQLIAVDAEGTYQFTHTRYRAIVYDSISASRRKQIHREIGAALVILPAEEVRGNAAQIAQHFDAAGDIGRAAKAYVDAAAAAVQRLAYPETEAHVKRALELLDQAADVSPASLWLRVQCAQWRTEYGRFREVVRDTREIVAHAQRLRDPTLESAARRALCMALFYSSQIPELVVAAKEAIECAVRSGDEIERAKLMVPLGVVQMSQGAIGAARDTFSQNVRVGRQSGDRRLTSPALIALGTLDYFESNYAAAERQLDEANALLQTARDGFLTASAQFFLALSLGNLGRFDAAFQLLRDAAAIAERNGDAYWSARIPNVRGWLFTELGAYAEARHHNTIAVRLSRTDPAPEPLANGLINLAIACAHAGEHAASSAALEEAGNLCAREAALRWRYDMRHKLATAECALARRDLATVCDAARIVLVRADEYGARKYAVDAHRLLAEALVRLGDVAAARKHVDNALDAAAHGAVPLVEWRLHAAAVRVHAAASDDGTAEVSRARLDHVLDGLVTQIADTALQRSLKARVAAMLAAS